MSRSWLRFAELVSLVLLGAGLLGLAAYLAHQGKMGEALLAVVGNVPLVIQAIRGVGQAQAMNAMADALARSMPVKGGDDVP